VTSVLLATRLVAMQTSTVRRSRNGDKQKKKRNIQSKYTAVMTPQAKKLRILSYLSSHAKAMLAILCHTFATFCNEQNCTNRDSKHITILIFSKSRTHGASHSIRCSLHRGCGQDLRTCDGDFPLRLTPAMDPTVQGRKFWSEKKRCYCVPTIWP